MSAGEVAELRATLLKTASVNASGGDLDKAYQATRMYIDLAPHDDALEVDRLWALCRRLVKVAKPGAVKTVFHGERPDVEFTEGWEE